MYSIDSLILVPSISGIVEVDMTNPTRLSVMNNVTLYKSCHVASNHIDEAHNPVRHLKRRTSVPASAVNCQSHAFERH